MPHRAVVSLGYVLSLQRVLNVSSYFNLLYSL